MNHLCRLAHVNVFVIAISVIAPPAFAQEPAETTVAYSSMGDDGIFVATKDVWYFEEYDDRSRPISGVLWKSGAIAERTSWTYRGDGQCAAIKIVTNDASSTTYEYDDLGNVLRVTALNPKGDVTESVANEYDSDGNLTLSIVVKGTETIRTEFTYDKGELAMKRMYRNGEQTMTWQSTGANGWTETMYRKDEVVLVIEYVDGVRKARQ